MAAARPFRFFDQHGRMMGPRVSQAAQTSNQRRNRIGFDRDTPAIFQQTDRTALMSIGRWLYANVGLVRAVLDDQSSIIASDITPQWDGMPTAGSEEVDRAWADAAELWLHEHDRMCDIRGDAFPMRTLHRLWMLHILRDGDVGVILTEGAGGYPLLQTIPAHRIRGNAAQLPEGQPYAGYQLVDGVILNAYGRPVAYRVYQDGREVFEDIDAQDMKLRFLPQWADQVRGVSMIASAIIDLQDVDESRKFELIAQKVASAIAVIEHNEDGVAPSDDPGNAILSGDSTVSDAGLVEPTARSMNGGEWQYFRSGSGSKLEALRADRPTPAQQQFMDSIIRQAMAGVGWSVDYFLDPSKVGGASMRVVVERINRHVRMVRGQCLFPLVRSIDTWRIAKAIKSGMLAANEQWYRWRYEGAADLTADARYAADVAVIRMDRGLTSPQVEAERIGNDWMAAQDQTIEWYKRMIDRCSVAGIDPAMILPNLGKYTPMGTQPEQPPSDQQPAQGGQP